ncbi:hypothetical protein F4775DRAFT_543209 [Biscogniauxia sp. FL1348]|nr:hypothetical protein F4775DRAFT_543209 [Biscogniauxia sp. FL1348]
MRTTSTTTTAIITTTTLAILTSRCFATSRHGGLATNKNIGTYELGTLHHVCGSTYTASMELDNCYYVGRANHLAGQRRCV